MRVGRRGEGGEGAEVDGGCGRGFGCGRRGRGAVEGAGDEVGDRAGGERKIRAGFCGGIVGGTGKGIGEASGAEE